MPMPRTREQLEQAATEAEAWLDPLDPDATTAEISDLRAATAAMNKVAAAPAKATDLGAARAGARTNHGLEGQRRALHPPQHRRLPAGPAELAPVDSVDQPPHRGCHLAGVRPGRALEGRDGALDLAHQRDALPAAGLQVATLHRLEQPAQHRRRFGRRRAHRATVRQTPNQGPEPRQRARPCKGSSAPAGLLGLGLPVPTAQGRSGPTSAAADPAAWPGGRAA